MPQPRLTIDAASPPCEDTRRLAQSLFNLFPEWDVRAFGEIDSTNAEARRLALTLGGDAWPRIILADFQSGGQGRRGRTWVAPRESSLLASIMVPMVSLRHRLTLVPLAVGCWLAEGFESLGLHDVRLKWPNDVLARGQKISGILCQTFAGAFVAGIGANLTQRPEELPLRAPTEPQATSAAMELGEEWPGRLAAAMTLMNAVLASFEHPPDAGWVLTTYREKCVTLGSAVACNDGGGETVVGLAEDIDPDGALVVGVPGRGRVTMTQPVEAGE